MTALLKDAISTRTLSRRWSTTPAHHPRRPVRQHCARLQLVSWPPTLAAEARRLRRDRGGLWRRPRCGEVPATSSAACPGIRPDAVRGRGHSARAEITTAACRRPRFPRRTLEAARGGHCPTCLRHVWEHARRLWPAGRALPSTPSPPTRPRSWTSWYERLLPRARCERVPCPRCWPRAARAAWRWPRTVCASCDEQA